MGFSAVPGSRSANHFRNCPFYQITEKSQHILATTIPDVDGEE